jgi:flagellar biosynthetic protein FliP
MTVKRLIFVILLGLSPALVSTGLAQESTNSVSETAVIDDVGESVGESFFSGKKPSQLVENWTSPDQLSSSLEIMLLLTVLTLVPSILVMTTCFTRIIVVLALLRQAIGTQGLPPTQVLTGLSLFMTFCVMAPTWQSINTNAIVPYISPAEGEVAISQIEAWGRAKVHIRSFMMRQIETCGNIKSVYMFASFGNPSDDIREKIRSNTLQWKDISMVTLVPAYITSELKQAFLMGFYIYMPFLIIDMVIASILMSMGMMMLPPVLISLPFKLLLFVLVDGWRLIVETLMHSFTNNIPV